MDKFKYHVDGTRPTNGELFVFGSNLAGIHGAGAARAAHDRFGAEWGVGFGITGNAVAIPTKNELIDGLDFDTVKSFIYAFVVMTRTSHKKFFITRVGCGLAGYKDEQIAPLFKRCDPSTCDMPIEWRPYLEN